ncbi:tRNA-intron lyase [Halorarius litoreus]|uniref:tRNA-intron lyase n=1 Tax=Halorarius litoreus TaxID=2962676 RepID=UPI0020CF76F3|nr:tRNA-intron lyase [Halorarius litoreus]
MQAHVEGDLVVLDAPGRERFYDSRGYGDPRGDGLALSRVEAAHLLYRGDIDAVEGRGFESFLTSEPGLAARFLVYKNLRDRGFYLSAAREGWVDDPAGADFIVFPRGQGPWDDAVEYRVRVVAERESVPADALGDVVLAVVDEESELTYLETDHIDVSGSTATTLDWSVDATLLDDRAVVWGPPEGLYHEGFYGQPLDDQGTALQLSLVEAAYLAREGVISFEGNEGRDASPGQSAHGAADGVEAVVDCGREAEGERFDRRLSVYADLRGRGVVPKTGFKFGADFRTYADVESVDALGHSELLVRVLPANHVFSPRDLSLDVRLAHGVRKRMVFAFTSGDGIEWLTVGRLTP